MTSPGETRSVFVHTSEVRRDAAASEAVSSMEEEREGASSYASETESPSAPASLAKGRTVGGSSQPEAVTNSPPLMEKDSVRGEAERSTLWGAWRRGSEEKGSEEERRRGRGEERRGVRWQRRHTLTVTVVPSSSESSEPGRPPGTRAPFPRASFHAKRLQPWQPIAQALPQESERKSASASATPTYRPSPSLPCDLRIVHEKVPCPRCAGCMS
mmetsp:Transcript_7696/g.22462  ORF Transcript_7696/g.22462 Transcript_7696/m.22462 type:complete len:214 (+) Transcript_7696:261-902(+)